jgi:hypothetical protein
MYGFTLDIRCDEDATNPIPRIVTDSVAKNQCNPRVYLDSDAGKALHDESNRVCSQIIQQGLEIHDGSHG